MIVSEATSTSAQEVTNPALLVERTVSGRGQQQGGIETTIQNPSTTESAHLVYLETLPWFMKPHYHTLQTRIRWHENGSQVLMPTGETVKSVYYRPAVDRVRASHLELVLEVPPASTLTLSYDFEKAILRYTEYPPDANRGFDVAPAVIKIMPSSAASSAQSGPEYLRTTSLLLYLPTPDFSMPYNVVGHSLLDATYFAYTILIGR